MGSDMTAERNQDMESKILEAADNLFSERGFAMTSTTEIAKEAGCNQALVHYYFRTKDRLFEAIFELKLKLFVKAFLKIGNEDLPFEEKLRRKIEAHFDILAANQRLPFLVINELLTNPERVKGIRTRIIPFAVEAYEQFDKELKAAIANGEIRPIAPIDLMLNVISINVSIFIASPVIRTVMGLDDKAFAELVTRRRAETVETILRSLRP
jgi:AcrR family transcriptional regulator